MKLSRFSRSGSIHEKKLISHYTHVKRLQIYECLICIIFIIHQITKPRKLSTVKISSPIWYGRLCTQIMMYLAQQFSTASGHVTRQAIPKQLYTHPQTGSLPQTCSVCLCSFTGALEHTALLPGRGAGRRSRAGWDQCIVHPLRGGGRRRGMEERNPEYKHYYNYVWDLHVSIWDLRN